MVLIWFLLYCNGSVLFACQIADEHKAVLLADMAHISGLVAAKVRTKSVEYII